SPPRIGPNTLVPSDWVGFRVSRVERNSWHPAAGGHPRGVSKFGRPGVVRSWQSLMAPGARTVPRELPSRCDSLLNRAEDPLAALSTWSPPHVRCDGHPDKY